MAHTALYGGTVYEKKGGADLVGGTVYKKDHGKVLVGGTAYEVGFDDGMRTVTVVSDVPGNHSYGYVGIRYNLQGENYYPHYIETAGTYELPVGTYFYFHTSFWSGGSATIYLNGERVGEYSRDEADYYYTLAEDISVSIEAGYNTVIKITET